MGANPSTWGPSAQVRKVKEIEEPMIKKKEDTGADKKKQEMIRKEVEERRAFEEMLRKEHMERELH